ncbi:MAG: hypothetical protein IT379_33260 [Deltaproteobacteria bacterium]|nr:hypothetical protein [Deltaproteobacteria bacterium]
MTEAPNQPNRWAIAGALGLVTMGVLTLEVLLSRLLSVVTWYSVGFLVLSLAMLGLTAGGLWVHLRPARFTPERLTAEIARACLWTALAVPVATAAALVVPVPLIPKVTTLAAALVLAALLALPFAAAGIVIAAALTYTPGRVGVLYAVDLVGSAVGCLLAFPLLDALDAPSAMIVAASLPALGGAVVAPSLRRRIGAVAAALAFVVLGVLNASAPNGLRVTYVKGFPEITRLVFERWNTFSRVGVEPFGARPPFYWGPSRRAPFGPVVWAAMRIDGDAGTPLLAGTHARDFDYLRWDVTSFGHFLRPDGRACIIGVGGGRDVGAALSFDHREVLAIEMNPIFVDLLRNPPYGRPSLLARDRRVRLVVDEGRSHLARAADLRCNILVVSLVDTWAATGAGSMVLGENGLYTLEAFDLMMSRLTPAGVLSVSRWYSPRHADETSRLAALGSAALLQLGVREPRRHLVLVAAGQVATLLVYRRPLTEHEVARTRELAELYGYRILLAPDEPGASEWLRNVASARSHEALADVSSRAPFDVTPPTDDRPFFFHVIRASDWLRPGHLLALADSPGMVKGNTIAILALLVLGLVVAILTVLAVVLPLRALARRDRQTFSSPDREMGSGPGTLSPNGDRGGVRGERSRDLPPHGGVETEDPMRLGSAPGTASRRARLAGGAFFVLVGCGFMVVEIALVQRLGVFLGHPTYSLGVTLFGVILFTGIGSALSETFARWRWRGLVPLVAALVALVTAPLLGVTTSAFAGADTMGRIALSVAHVALVGLALGLQLPTGIAAIRRTAPSIAAWCWGVSGAAGVLGSVLALVVSLHAGISATMAFGAVLYALAAWPLVVLVRQADSTRVRL